MKSDKKIIPLGDRVLLRLSEPQKQQGRILLPEKFAPKPQSGEVLAVGPDCKCEKSMKGDEQRIRPEMVVIFNQYAGTTVPGDDTLLLIREDELLGVMEA